MKVEIKGVQPMSLIISSLPVVIFILGIVGGLLSFVFLPSAQAQPMAFSDRMIAVGLFSIIYMMVFLGAVVFAGIIYNILTQVLGMRGIKLELEEAEDEIVSLK